MTLWITVFRKQTKGQGIPESFHNKGNRGTMKASFSTWTEVIPRRSNGLCKYGKPLKKSLHYNSLYLLIPESRKRRRTRDTYIKTSPEMLGIMRGSPTDDKINHVSEGQVATEDFSSHFTLSLVQSEARQGGQRASFPTGNQRKMHSDSQPLFASARDIFYS